MGEKADEKACAQLISMWSKVIAAMRDNYPMLESDLEEADKAYRDSQNAAFDLLVDKEPNRKKWLGYPIELLLFRTSNIIVYRF